MAWPLSSFPSHAELATIRMPEPHWPPPSPPLSILLLTTAICFQPQLSGFIPLVGAALRFLEPPSLAYNLYTCGPRVVGCHEYVLICLMPMALPRSTSSRPP